jgi:hypothetical protein
MGQQLYFNLYRPTQRTRLTTSAKYSSSGCASA